MRFEEQVSSHLHFLQSHGLAVEELVFSKAVRCCAIGNNQGRGEYWYKSQLNQMNGGKVGIVTVVRGQGGRKEKHTTYGMPDTGKECVRIPVELENQSPLSKREAEEKARIYFEQHCKENGFAPYLNLKNVKAYGIKYRCSELYGSSAVVPARDVTGNILSCLHLNQDGSKKWLGGSYIVGAFHALAPLDGISAIGICEGYATAATCMEVMVEISPTPISIVAAFGCWNLAKVGHDIKSRFPKAKIVFLADNDRHLLKNEGVEAARDASKRVGGTSIWLAPDFANLGPAKDASDWNDLARVLGIEEVKRQLKKVL